jgi:hypothetical protein
VHKNNKLYTCNGVKTILERASKADENATKDIEGYKPPLEVTGE